MNILTTNRLILRTWRDDDLEALSVINQDKTVTKAAMPASARSISNVQRKLV